MNGCFLYLEIAAYQIHMLKNSIHTLKPGSKANLEGFVSLIRWLKGFCLKPICTHSLEASSFPARQPCSTGGSLAAVQTPCLHSILQNMLLRPSETRVPRPPRGRAGKDVGSTAAGEPISSHSWGCTMWERLTPRTQRQGKFTEGKLRREIQMFRLQTNKWQTPSQISLKPHFL